MKKKSESNKLLNVLYLEDSSQDFELIYEQLKDAGLNLKMDNASNGKEFEKLLNENGYDFILSDYKLPGYDAFKALENVKIVNPNLPFICISGTIGEEIAIKLIKKGAVDYILKDRPERLPFAIRNALNDIKEKKARIQAEQALRESEEKHRTLFETMAQGVVYHNLKGEIISANPAAEKILGLSLDQMKGRKSIDPRWHAIHEDGSEFPGEIHPAMVALNTGEEVKNVIMGVFNPRNEEYRWINVNAVPQFRANEKKPYQVYATLEDITNSKQIEQSLKESENKFRNIIESTPMGMFIYQLEPNNKLVLVDTNKAAEKILGVNVKHFMGKTVEEAFPLIKNTEIPLRFRRAAKNGEYWNSQQISYNDDKISGTFEVHVFQTEPGKIAVMFSDVTDKKKAKEALEESEKKYRLLAENVTDVIWTMDLNLRFTYVSPSVLQLRGYNSSETMNQSINEVMLPESVKHAINLLNQRLQQVKSGKTSGWKPVSFEAEQYCKDGGTKITHNNAKLIKGNDGTPSLIVGLTYDITKRKKAEEALQKEKFLSEEYINSLPGLFYVFDDKQFIKWNKEFEKVSGYTPKELSTMYGTDFFEGEEKLLLAERMREVFTKGAAEVEAEFVTKKGKRIPYYFNGMRKEFSGKQYLVGLGINISQLKQAEKLRIESEEKLRNIIENSTNLFYSHTADHKITYISPQSEEFLQCKPKEAMIRWTEFATDNPINEIGIKRTEKALKTGQRQPTYELELVGKKGKIIYTEVNEAPVVKNGKVTGIVGSLTDITERKKAAEMIQQSEERYRAVVEQSRDCIFLAEIDSLKIIEANPAMQKMLGYKVKEILKLTLFDFIANDKKSIKQNLNQIIKSGYKFIGEREYYRKDRSKVDVEVSASLISYQHKQVLSVVSRDITERKKINQALKESETKLSAIVQSIDEGIIYTDLSGKIIHVNDPLVKILDISKSEFLDKDALQLVKKFVSKRQLPVLLSKMALAFKGKSIKPYEINFKNKILEINTRYDKRNKRITAILRDITERKHFDNKLRDSEEQYRLIVENAHDGIEISQNNKIIFANSCFADMLGYTAEELKVISFNQFFTEKGTQELIERNKKRDTGLSVPNNYETTFCKKDGTIIDVDIKYEIIQYKNKPATFAIIRDITDRKKADIELKKRLDYELLISEISALAIKVENLENFQKKCLALLGKTLDVSRIYIFEYFQNNTMLENTFEWVGKGVTKQIDNLKGIPANEFSWWLKQLQKNEIINYQDITQIPDKNVRKVLKQQSIKSILVVPLYVSDQLFGFMGFDECRNLREWPQVDVMVLLSASRIISGVIERKQAEEALIENEKLLRQVIDTAPYSIFVKDRDGQYILVNKHMANSHNKTPKEMVGLTDLNVAQKWLKTPEAIEKFRATEREVTDKKKPLFIKEEKFTFKDEREKWFQTIKTPISLKSNPRCLMGMAVDITERKEAEMALQLNEERLDLAMSVANDGMWDWDLINNKAYFDPRYYTMAGYEPNEFPGNFEEWAKRVHPEDFVDVEKEINAYLAGHIPNYDVEFRFKTKDEGWIWIRGRGKIVSWKKDGTPLRMLGTHADITERKQGEVALSESEEKFRNLIEQSNDAIYLLFENKFELINSRFENLFGYTLQDCQKSGFNFRQLIADKSLPMIENRVERTKKGEKLEPVYEFSAVSKNGQEIECEVSTSYVDFRGGTAVQGIIRDITGRKQAEEEKKKLEKQLRHAQKLETIGTLAGGIAHDFNNILAPIMGYTDMALHRLAKSDPLYDDLNNVLKSSHRAKELVEQILLFSKQSEKERQPLELQSLLKEALKLLRPSIPTTVQIIQKINSKVENVKADATQIHQVIVNLCTNASQAMEDEGGTLTIELTQTNIDTSMTKLYPNLNQQEYALLSFNDTGPGMNEETLERIFEPFFTTKSVDKGTGLGLSVVHGIVRSHQGDILVRSELGKGSSFHVYLPIVKTRMPQHKTEKSEIIRGSEFVAIVDDESAVAEMVKRMLENFGYKTETFSNGPDALNAYKNNQDLYDLLISDLTMPQMTGLELADKLHKINPDFPVIIMTGFGDNITNATQKRHGIKKVIGKPIVIHDLTTTVRKILDN